MKRLPSRFLRLDGALAALPVEEPMLLTELDGFLTGVLLSPEPIPADEWMVAIWGLDTDGVPAFEDPVDVHWFVTAVTARRDEIARDLARAKLQPILDRDDRTGETLWEYWIDGVAEAIAFRPDAWAAAAADPAWARHWHRLTALIAIARDESDLDSIAINAFQDRAVAELIDVTHGLYAARARDDAAAVALAPAKIGRNDRCPCESGKKHKMCCGRS